MLGEKVDDSGLVAALAFAVEDEAVYAGLEAVFIMWEGVEVEVEEALAVPLADGMREEVSQKAQAVMRVTWPFSSEGSHFGSSKGKGCCFEESAVPMGLDEVRNVGGLPGTIREAQGQLRMCQVGGARSRIGHVRCSSR